MAIKFYPKLFCSLDPDPAITIELYGDQLSLLVHGARVGVPSFDTCLWSLHGLAARGAVAALSRGGFTREVTGLTTLYIGPGDLTIMQGLSAEVKWVQRMSWQARPLYRNNRCLADRASKFFRDACDHGEALVRKMLEAGAR